MALSMSESGYTPADIARVLSENYGYQLTPAAIRKWDNIICSHLYKDRKKNEARDYTKEDIRTFHIIAMLRTLGYSVEETRQIIPSIMIATKGSIIILSDVKNRMEKQMAGFKEFFELLDKRIHSIK